MKIENLSVAFSTHITITDLDTGVILCKGSNAIHQENMSQAIAESLARGSNFFISEMHFGRGASTTLTDGTVTYKSPNISGSSANLHKDSYFRVVDEEDLNNPDSAANKVSVSHTAGTTYTDIVVTATLDYSDPVSNDTVFNIVNSTEQSLDATTLVDGEFVFDEIGLKTRGVSGLDTGKLLTHFIFHPVEKTSGQRIQIDYVLRVQAG